MRLRHLLPLLAALSSACDDGGSAESPADAALGTPDASPDAAPPSPDASPDPDGGPPPADAALDAADGDAAVPDAAVDAFVPDPAWFPPAAAPFRAGAATRRLPVPVGIGTSGFGPRGSSKTPYAEAYPGTVGMHTQPDVKAVVVEAGEGNRVVFVRLDAIGVSAAMRRSLVARLEARYGADVDRQLIIAATHTHAGPGRLIDKPLWHLIQDRFFPEFYVRMVDTIEEAVVAAFDDLEPARIGNGAASTTALHNDRRCANPVETEPELPILKVERVADGSLKAVVLFHAVHPTIVGIERLMLSKDVAGGIESKVAERFDRPVTVVFFNGAAADMGPGSPPLPAVEGAAAWPDDFTRIENLGNVAADVVHAALPAIATEAEGVVHARIARLPIDRELIGYGAGEFPHQNGAVYCGAGSEEACVGEPLPPPRSLTSCIPFPDRASSAPRQTPVSAARVGERVFMTTPGEFSIELGRRIRTALHEAGQADVVIVGYAQEYTGYSLPEDDWWRGGYEASGALWGPKQGDYLTGHIIGAGLSFLDPTRPLTFREAPVEPEPGPYAPEPRAALRSTAPPAIVADAPASAGPDTVVEMTWEGGDPWLGNPVVTIERQVDDGFAPVTTAAGAPFDSDGYAMTLELSPDPPYTEEAESRRFRWTVKLPVRRPAGGGPALDGGTFRLVARGRAHVAGEAEPVDYALPGAAFSVP